MLLPLRGFPRLGKLQLKPPFPVPRGSGSGCVSPSLAASGGAGGPGGGSRAAEGGVRGDAGLVRRALSAEWPVTECRPLARRLNPQPPLCSRVSSSYLLRQESLKNTGEASVCQAHTPNTFCFVINVLPPCTSQSWETDTPPPPVPKQTFLLAYPCNSTGLHPSFHKRTHAHTHTRTHGP